MPTLAAHIFAAGSRASQVVQSFSAPVTAGTLAAQVYAAGTRAAQVVQSGSTETAALDWFRFTDGEWNTFTDDQWNEFVADPDILYGVLAAQIYQAGVRAAQVAI